MVKANIIIKRTEPNNTFYKLDELGIIIVKHMIEIKMLNVAASPKNP
jgi:hypothetical protein